mgnify:CR=1 FL=1
MTRGKQHPHTPTVAALSTKTKQPEVSLGLLVIENQSQFTGKEQRAKASRYLIFA